MRFVSRVSRLETRNSKLETPILLVFVTPLVELVCGASRFGVCISRRDAT